MTRALKWTDIHDLATALAEKYPQVDPTTVRFTDLHNWVLELDGFADDPRHSGEKILEAIQQAWIADAEE